MGDVHQQKSLAFFFSRADPTMKTAKNHDYLASTGQGFGLIFLFAMFM
jgi:hypothetical protein